MAVIKNWNMNLALGLRNDFGSQFTQTAFSANIAAATDTTFLVPSGSGVGKANDDLPKFLARFRYAPTAIVFVAVQTASNGVITALPSATAAFVANQSIINPECKEVKGGDILHFYSTLAAAVTVELYAI